MLSVYNILTIARFEIKILLRSWFFRIFSILVLVILGFTNYGLLYQGAPWGFKALPSFIPYYNLQIINIIQAIIAIFLASDFLKRDKKLDTTEVIYIRSMSNGDYVIGKTSGIIFVFILFNLIILLQALIFNLLAKDIYIDIISYLIYPLLISIPTLVFIFGLSFFLMGLIRNQSVTFILLLAYVGVTTFYLGDKMHFLLDYIAFNVPLAKSDYIGFSNLSDLLIHRGIYFLFGLGLIFGTVYNLKRLYQSKQMKVFSLAMLIICVGSSIFLSAKYLIDYNSKHRIRNTYLETNNNYSNKKICTITKNHLDVTHLGKTISVIAELELYNANSEALDDLVFSLNPGLNIEKIISDNNILDYKRENQIIQISLNQSLIPKDSLKISILYSGYIDENVCYLDIDTAKINEQNRFANTFINVDKKYAILTPSYVLLTQEALWYPSAGVGYCSNAPFNRNIDFTGYSLHVKTKPGLMAISQGIAEKTDEGEFYFNNTHPLSQISLIIGDYQKISTVVDSIEYALYTSEEHDYFIKYQNEIGDTIGHVINELKEDFERRLGLKYPFSKFAIIDVPIQFYSYSHCYSAAIETMQPEMTFIAENGANLDGVNFRRWDRNYKRNPDNKTPVQSQVEAFKSVFISDFAPTTVRDFSKGITGEKVNPFSIFPLYYSYAYNIHSDKYPIINNAFELYYFSRIEGQMWQYSKRSEGLSSAERANLYLKNGSLKYHIDNEKDNEKLYDLIKAKGDYLFTILKYNFNDKGFEDTIYTFLNSNTFTKADFNHLINKMDNNTSIDVHDQLMEWYDNNNMPKYIIDEGDYYMVLKGQEEVFQFIFKITNYGDLGGYFKTNFFERDPGFGGGIGYGSDSKKNKIYYLNLGETKEIGVLTNKHMRRMEINTLISQNIPNVIVKANGGSADKNETVIPLDGERILNKAVTNHEKDNYIVDNEDEGFSVIEPTSKKLFGNLLKSKDEQKFKYINWDFNVEHKWKLFSHSYIYGDFIRSACYVKAGEGDFKAIWKTALPETGEYDVYAYLDQHHIGLGSRRRNNGEYSYTIYHEDGEENVILNMKDKEDGWNYLGTYYFSTDTAKVVLDNKSSNPKLMIYADAMKWVRK